MADANNQLSDEDCNVILQNYLKRKDCKVTSYTIDSLSETREGFIGDHFILKIQYEDDKKPKNVRLFLKVLNASLQIIFDLSVSLNAYEKEEFFYDFLLKEYEKYDIDVSFAPKGYFAKPYRIVLEDLGERGFKTCEKLDPYDLDQFKVTLKALAKFHASGIQYEEIKSRELGSKFTLFETYPNLLDDKLFNRTDNLGAKWFNCSVDSIMTLIDLLPENEITADEFRKELRRRCDTFPNEVEPSEKYRNTTLHGDLWVNNLMLRYDNNMPSECVIIDFQILKYGPPAIDLIQTIFTNTRKALRDAHYDEFLEYYYQCLSDCLSSKHLQIETIYPKNEYLESCRKFRAVSMVHTICDHSMTFMDEASIADACSTEDGYRKYLFEDRCSCTVASFQNNKNLREVLEEDLLQLREILFEK